MAIDSASKRRRAASVRSRLPWLNRLAVPAPDGSLDGTDRAELGGTYFTPAVAVNQIDTPSERARASALRRLPWFRRLSIPAPDGTIGTTDRAQLAYIYRAGAPPAADPALTVTDNENGTITLTFTGVVGTVNAFAIASCDATDRVSLGSRSGDGTIGPVAIADGSWVIYGDTTPLAGPVFLSISATGQLQDNLLEWLEADLRAAAILSGIDATNIRRLKRNHEIGQTFPAVLMQLVPEVIDPNAGGWSTSRVDLVYQVMVIQAANQDVTAAESTWLDWRWLIFDRYHRRKAEGYPDVEQLHVEPGTPRMPDTFSGANLDVQSWLIRARTRRLRPCPHAPLTSGLPTVTATNNADGTVAASVAATGGGSVTVTAINLADITSRTTIGTRTGDGSVGPTAVAAGSYFIYADTSPIAGPAYLQVTTAAPQIQDEILDSLTIRLKTLGLPGIATADIRRVKRPQEVGSTFPTVLVQVLPERVVPTEGGTLFSEARLAYLITVVEAANQDAVVISRTESDLEYVDEGPLTVSDGGPNLLSSLELDSAETRWINWRWWIFDALNNRDPMITNPNLVRMWVEPGTPRVPEQFTRANLDIQTWLVRARARRASVCP